MSNEVVTIRDGRGSDVNFIVTTFLKGLYHGNPWYNEIPRPIYMENYRKFIQGLLMSGRIDVKVACLVEDPDVLVGYSITDTERKTIHWVYVKAAWRLNGLARKLLPKEPKAYSHFSTTGKTLSNKYKDIIFNPFAI